MEESLFEVSKFQPEIESGDKSGPIKYVVASSLKDLIKQGMEQLSLTGQFQLTSSNGIPVESDLVLKLLVTKGQSRFFLRALSKETADAAASEVDPTTTAPTAINGPLENEEGNNGDDRVTAPTESVSTGQNDHPPPPSSDEFYPVLDIMREMKLGRRTKETADEIIATLLSRHPRDFSDSDRTKVHKGVGPWLMARAEKVAFCPTPAQYEKMAKSIVHYFKGAANLNSPSCPWNLWYSRDGNKGTLERYVRNKRMDENKTKPTKASVAKRRKLLNGSSDDHSIEEIKQAMDYMRRNVPTPDNKIEMLEKFAITHSKRIEMVADKKNSATKILKGFPRLMDCIDAVEYDFNLLKGAKLGTFVENYREMEPSIFSLACSSLKSSESRVIVQLAKKAEEEYDHHAFTFHVIQLLLFLLPNTLPRFRRTGVKTAESMGMLIQKFEDGTDVTVAVKAAQGAMKQPGIIIIGNQFFLKIEELAITYPGMCNIENALASLISLYYILGVEYPEAVKLVYIFFEHVFDFEEKSFDSTAVNCFMSKIKAVTIPDQ